MLSTSLDRHSFDALLKMVDMEQLFLPLPPPLFYSLNVLIYLFLVYALCSFSSPPIFFTVGSRKKYVWRSENWQLTRSITSTCKEISLSLSLSSCLSTYAFCFIVLYF